MNEMMPIFHGECNFVVLLHFERFEILITVWELHNGIPHCPCGSLLLCLHWLCAVSAINHEYFTCQKKFSLQKLTKHGCIRYDLITISQRTHTMREIELMELGKKKIIHQLLNGQPEWRALIPINKSEQVYGGSFMSLLLP